MSNLRNTARKKGWYLHQPDPRRPAVLTLPASQAKELEGLEKDPAGWLERHAGTRGRITQADEAITTVTVEPDTSTGGPNRERKVALGMTALMGSFILYIAALTAGIITYGTIKGSDSPGPASRREAKSNTKPTAPGSDHG